MIPQGEHNADLLWKVNQKDFVDLRIRIVGHLQPDTILPAISVFVEEFGFDVADDTLLCGVICSTAGFAICQLWSIE